jgi:3-oxoacyl-[acyl-carrier-protein] synthase II
MVSPLGPTVETSWTAAVRGESGIGPITRFDAAAFPTRICGSVKDFNVEQYLSAKEARKMDAFQHYGFAAGVQAFTESGLTVTDGNSARVGAIIGAGIGGLETIEEMTGRYLEAKGPRKISPFYIPGSIINMISGHLSIKYGFTGPNLAVVTACTTGTHAIGLAARLIAYGDADAMLAGGAEMGQTPTAVGGFSQAKALSERNDNPQAASRPWDKDRDGFVLGDGAGAIMLEEYEHARKRGANIHAEMIGFGMSGDAYHITAPPEDGEGARLAMANALADARINPEDVQHINAHATSTPLGDRAETVAMKRAFGDHAYKLAISSTKSMTGHLLGAAGAVEAIFTILAIRDQIVPPTVNLDEASPDCDLDYVPKTARRLPIRCALSNSFGFGGTNGTVVFRQLT